MRPTAKWFAYLVIFAIIVALLPTSSALATDATTTSVVTQQSGIATATANNAANIRSGPGTGFWIIGVLAAQETVPINGVSPDGAWWLITTSFGGQGWIANSTVTTSNTANVPVSDPGPIISVTIGQINIRSGPGENASVLGIANSGSQLFLLGRNSNGTWLNVGSQFGNGWVLAELTSVGAPLSGGGADTEVTAEDGTTIAVTADQAIAIVNAAFLNVRSGPGINYSILGVVEGGDRLNIIGTNAARTWFNVETPFGEGWVSDLYVVTQNEFGGSAVTTDTVDPTSIINPIAIVNAESLNVRSGPSADFTIVGTVSGGEQFELLARTVDFTWVLVDGETVDGWVRRRFVIIRGDTSRLAVANATNATAVENPVTGETVDIAPEITGPIAFVATGALNIRTGPNVAFEPLGFVYAGTRMPIIGQSADRNWWLVESPLGEGWVNKSLIIVENDATNVPVR